LHQELVRNSAPDKLISRPNGIPFEGLPGQSELFLRFLDDPISLKRFYPNAFERPLDCAGFIPEVLKGYSTDRVRLCDALARMNGDLGASKATLNNVELLRRDDTVAVVTGQQTGLFTGPIYTVYKALSAIRLADELRSEGRNAVPVFWMATEDHDFDEVSTAKFFAETGNVLEAKYIPKEYINGAAVGDVRIGPEINAVLEGVFAALPRTQFSEKTAESIQDLWKPGVSFGQAFGRSILMLLGHLGIVVLDPSDLELKHLAAPIYAEAIRKSHKIVESIRQHDEQLSRDGFHSQVLVDSDYFPLFWTDENKVREPLRKVADGVYRARSRGRELLIDELLEIARVAPETLSPGVMLRPVVQDHLLPTVAYFGGAAEIAYFAQNSAVYEALDRPVTPIFHRQSFTVSGARERRSLERLGLNIKDLFDGVESVLARWEEQNVDPETAMIFAEAEEVVNTQLARIDSHLSEIDTTLLANASKRRRKMIYHIAAIRKKALRALSRKNADAERRITSACEILAPDRHLQERSLNVFSFINSYGPKFVDLLYEAVDLNDKRHRILEI
jgi:bacillithiol biosynthesis cysteine-adding enzyme BshC